MRTRRPLSLLLLLALGACGSSGPVATTLGFDPPTPTGASTSRPLTIPALDQWAAAAGSFRWTRDLRLVLGSDDATLSADAQTFAEDLQALTGAAPAVVRGGTVQAGDIELDLGAADNQLGDEGYRLSIGPGIVISANAPAGAFYGTRTVLQLLHQSAVIPAGIARDRPRYAERGLMIETGAQYYTPDWMAQHLKELAYLKLNYFSLTGYRFQSFTHPEAVQQPAYSQQQLRELVAQAARYHISVVPVLDMPGHMDSTLAAHPELQLKNALGQAAADKLDITNPAALQFASELIEEYLPLFPAAYWHMGADEYMPDAELPLYPQLQSYAQQQYGAGATAHDAILGFANRIDSLVRAHGKTLRIWNDELGGGSAVALHPDVIVEWWTDISPLSSPQAPKAQALLDQGHAIMNCGSFPTYYNAASIAYTPTADPQSMYEQWAVNQFSGAVFGPVVPGQPIRLPPEVIAAAEPRNLGSKVHVWGAEDERSIATQLFPRLRIMAQKTWESPPLAGNYADFQPIMNAVGHAPGFSLQ